MLLSAEFMWTLADPGTKPDGAAFGFSVAADGDLTVVGVPNAYSQGYNGGGAAYVFNSATGELVATLINPTPAIGDSFGTSVAISGNTVVVGAPHDLSHEGGSGSAYVFNAATGDLLRALSNPTPASGDYFGYVVAVSGNTVVVGADQDDTGRIDSGAAYMFDAAMGDLLRTLNNPTPAMNDIFGQSVAVSDGVVAVGAPDDMGASSSRGTVYVYLDNHAPTAAPGGPYVVHAWAALALDGSGSSDLDAALGDRIVSYAWDMDNDGQYDDATGPTPTVPWAQLAALAANRDLPVSLRVTDSFGVTGTASTTLRIIAPQVVGRHVFYNNSYWDGNNVAANAQDDAAIAPDKQALLPGQTATFANYTSYSRGVNGIMIDVSDLPPGTPTAGDFVFRAGRGGEPGSWPLTARPTSITVRRGAGAGGSDRVTLIWADAAAVRGNWLSVTVLAGGNVGLAAADELCFGNFLGEVGNSATDAKVDAMDIALTRANLTSFLNRPSITNPYDFNRDRRVDTLDIALVRSSQTSFLTVLKLIALPVGTYGPLGIVLPDSPAKTCVLGVVAGMAMPALAGGPAAVAGTAFALVGSAGAPVPTTMDVLAAGVTPSMGVPLGADLLDALGARRVFTAG